MTATVQLEKNGLTVSLGGEAPAYFNYFWLRENCDTAIDKQILERVYHVAKAPDDLCAVEARIEGDALVVRWSEGDHISHYSLAWLEKCAANALREDEAELPRTLWRGDYYPSLKRFDRTRLDAEPDLVADWAKTIITDGISLVQGVADSDEALKDLVHLLGHIDPCCFGYDFQVRVHADPSNIAYTTSALGLHTDLPSESPPPTVQFLHCRANESEGGESIFVDTCAVAEDFRNTHPHDFKLLCEVEVPFRQIHKNFDMRNKHPMIKLDHTGAVSGISLSQHLVDVMDLPQKQLDDFYPAFRRFIHALEDPAYLMEFRLEAGECVVFDNNRVAHGRRAFKAQTGLRHLHGCYLNLSEVRSTYRLLKARARANGISQAA